jgi:hypothetical protein
MVVFGNIFQVESNHMETPSTCAQHVKQFFCAFGLCLYMLSITLPNDILVQLSVKYFASPFSPHITFVSLPIEYALDLKVVW